MRITPLECMHFIPLGIQRAMRMRRIIIGGLSHATLFVHIIS